MKIAVLEPVAVPVEVEVADIVGPAPIAELDLVALTLAVGLSPSLPSEFFEIYPAL